ncbi:UNVERIFIED_CONTAM: hypothetical protein FKN15_014696 [Acipenser sinensis]
MHEELDQGVRLKAGILKTSLHPKGRDLYDELYAMASNSLEGFHEVNLASPTTPDLRTVSEARHLKQSTATAILYRTHPSVSSSPGPPNTLDVVQLPTQPVYSTPRHLSTDEASRGSVLAADVQIAVPCSSSGSQHHASRNEPARLEAEFLDGSPGDRGGEESGDVFGLSTDSLSHLRSPSVMEVREKGYERLKEELTKAQRHHASRNEPARLEAEFLDGSPGDRGGEESGDVFGLSTDSLSHLRSPSVMEVREKGYERLKEELTKAQRDLKLKDEECERLSKVRDQLGQELEELTASLFEEAHKMVREANVKQATAEKQLKEAQGKEAHKMVREANVKQATAEKQLKEAQGKIDVLQAEVAALKTLVLSTSPTSPSKDLPPGGKTPFKKGHARNKSTSSAMLGSQQELSMMQPIVRDCREVDLLLFSEFKAWREEPTLERTCSFLERIYKEDIYPCLTFSKSEPVTAQPSRGLDALMDVLGENEALQLFFEGHDVTSVLESPVVDTSMLERYLSNDIDPATFSFHFHSIPLADMHNSSSWATGQPLQVLFNPAVDSSSASCRFKEGIPGRHPSVPQQFMGLPSSYVNPSVPLTPACLSTASSSCLGTAYPYLPPRPSHHPGAVLPETKKRKHSDSFEGSVDQCVWNTAGRPKGSFAVNDEHCADASGYDSDGQNGSSGTGGYQSLTWTMYHPGQWTVLCNCNCESL